jgi:hypothetical protein
MEILTSMIHNDLAALTLIVLNFTFILYSIKARKLGYPMGIVYRYGDLFESISWILSLGLIVFLSHSYSWYFLVSFFLFPVLGDILARLIGPPIQPIYVLGSPLLLMWLIGTKLVSSFSH